ncbi:MAG: Rrf2 family transcriptional regulator [Alphaproteobacteria bacterium]|jgi:Rrf2 family protein|nr:Rrf2 family transcriptional regulator [Alphaproteobacteria bacterium]
MKLQTGTRIALYAVLELAADPETQLSAGEIGARYGVSAHHLAKVLHTLGRAGLVRSVRGAGGGYTFSGNAKRTTLLEIIELFERVGDAGSDSPEPGEATPVGRALGAVLAEIDAVTRATLGSITISTALKSIARGEGAFPVVAEPV